MGYRSYIAAVDGKIESASWIPPVGRINAVQTAKILGCEEHHIPVLVAEGLLKPLGKPVQNAPKYFAAVEILALAQNADWLSKATQILYDHWKTKNAKREKAEPQFQ